MNWTAIKAALLTWAEGQSGLNAQWGAREQYWDTKARLKLHLKAPTALGVDELRWDFDAGQPIGYDNIPTVSGQRAFTLQVECQSRDASASEAAVTHLEKLRTSLRKPSVLAAFRAAELAVVGTEAIQDLSGIVVDNREESRGILEIRFASVVNERDTTEGASHIEQIEVERTWVDVDGSTYQGTDTLVGISGGGEPDPPEFPAEPGVYDGGTP